MNINALKNALDDPLAYERGECERLANLLRDRYSLAGLAVQYAPDAKLELGISANLLGHWKVEEGREVPADIRLVNSLTAALDFARDAKHVGGSSYNTKRAVLLLRMAQVACEGEPKPDALALVNDTDKAIIKALYQGKVTTELDAQKISVVLALLQECSEDYVKERMPELRKLGLISAPGSRATMKYYLTDTGAALGRYLADNL